MYIIMAYDVNEKRVSKILKIARKYLNWIQNSLLEGELTVSKFEKLKSEVRKAINEEEDSVLFYVFSQIQQVEKQHLGQNKKIDILI
ncbi:MAG: CRISPR-associated endonuclease Cas2 [Fervidobacterium sp.]|nr:CRISPR-associated endonuclease Cas2 [Fervidobacterium sp.]